MKRMAWMLLTLNIIKLFNEKFRYFLIPKDEIQEKPEQ
jgi:hypothetical protein